MNIIKKLIIALFANIMKFASLLFPYNLSLRLGVLRDLLYTSWIRNFIGEMGEHSRIYYPCSLQGGGQKRIIIDDNTWIQSHCILGCWEKYGEQSFTPSLKIGKNCFIGEYNQITAFNRITVGDGLLTGKFVYIGDNAHGGLSWEEALIPPIRREMKSKGEIKIGNNVWVGDKVTILGGVTIGDNVIIGANSVVTHDVPSNCIAVGNPAKIIKRL